MVAHGLRNGLVALFLLLPTLAPAEDRIRVFDDDVLLAIKDSERPLSELPISVAALLAKGIANCSAYIEAGQPPVDGMLPPELRACQINTLIRAAVPSASQQDPCDALAEVGDGMLIGGFNTAMNQRWNLSKDERKLAVEFANIEVLPGCTGLSIVIDDWTIHFVLRAIADWNRDARPDYLLELIEFAHVGTYRASQLLVAASADGLQWAITTPSDLLRKEKDRE